MSRWIKVFGSFIRKANGGVETVTSSPIKE